LHEDMSNLRQKVCRKGFEVLHNEKGITSDHAKKISLMVDGMVKRRYPDERCGYFPVMKKLFRAIRVRKKAKLSRQTLYLWAILGRHCSKKPKSFDCRLARTQSLFLHSVRGISQRSLCR
jgi:hypothetical protein